MQDTMHPAVIEELHRKYSLKTHPFVPMAAVLSLLLELCAIVLSILVQPLLILIVLALLGYTVTSLLYLLVWTEKRRAESVSCMRLGFVIYAVLLFFPLIYPGSIVILLSLVFGGHRYVIWWVTMSGLALIYGHIVSFVSVLNRDKNRLLKRQLTAMELVQQPLLPRFN